MKYNLQKSIIGLFLFGIFACQNIGGAAEIKNISYTELKEMQSNTKDLVLLDVRTPEEISGGAIGKSIAMDFYSENFKDQLNTLDSNKTTVVYCASGKRSMKTAVILKEKGFNKVYNLKGGYSAIP